MFIGVALLIVGASLNRAFLKELLLFRGASRRAPSGDAPPVADDATQPKMRIR